MKACIPIQPTLLANRLIWCFLAMAVLSLGGCQQRPVDFLEVTATPSSTPVSMDSSAAIKTPTPRETATSIPVTPTLQASATPTGDLPFMRPVPDHCFLVALSPNNIWMVLDCHGQGPTSQMPAGAWVNRIGEEDWILLATSKEFPEGTDAAWSPDGTMLAVTAGRGPVLLFQTGQWHSRRVIHEATEWPHSAPIWSPDNKTIAITNLKQGVALTLVEIDGTSRDLLYDSEINPIPKLFEYCEPTWSPDGKQIAYLVRSDLKLEKGQAWIWTQLWTVDVTSGAKQLLLDPNGGISFPEWSPDGKKIAMLTGGLSVLDLQTKSLTSVLRVGEFPTYKWSPDSDRLAVDTDKGLFVVSVVTGERKLLANEDKFNIIRWTSDGKHLIVLEYIPSTYEHILKMLPVE